ncbi:DUF5018 domain-containing protein [Sphingobacterium paucimobilis]|uniref:DUF5018 domain-containing protein n=1 Tax=Sphingobacterium paucimobilis TaxID=1385985 RepID=UPI00041FC3D4|nr:DUF5018 domain-containing protein [Sphingobacterium paucimobilis]
MKNKLLYISFLLSCLITSCSKEIKIERGTEGVITDIFANIEGSGPQRLFEARYSNDTIYFDIPYYYPINSDYETDLTKIIVRASISSDAKVSTPFGKPMDLTSPFSFTVVSGSGVETKYVIKARKLGDIGIADAKISFELDGEIEEVDGILINDELRFFIVPGQDMSQTKLTFSINKHATSSIESGSVLDLNTPKILTISGPGGASKNYNIVLTEPVKLEYGFGVHRKLWFKEWAEFGFGGIGAGEAEQSLAVSGDYLIIGKAGTSGNARYMVYNRFTGEYLRDMYMPFTASSGAFADSRQLIADEKGNLLAINRSLINNGLQVYRYNSPFDLTPQLMINTINNQGAGTTGLRLNVTGDLDGDAVIVSTKSSTKSFYRWEIKNGVLQSQQPTLVTVGVAKGSTFGIYPEVQYIHPTVSSNYLLAFQNGFFHVNGNTDQQIHEVNMSATFFMNALSIARFNKATYTFLGRYYSNLKTMGLSMFDITDPQMFGTPTSSSLYPLFNVFNSERLRAEQDSPGTGDIAVGYSHDGDRMQVYMLHVGSGVLAHEFTVYSQN